MLYYQCLGTHDAVVDDIVTRLACVLIESLRYKLLEIGTQQIACHHTHFVGIYLFYMHTIRIYCIFRNIVIFYFDIHFDIICIIYVYIYIYIYIYI